LPASRFAETAAPPRRTADKAAHVRRKRQIVPRAANIETKIRDFLARRSRIGGGFGDCVQIEPTFAEIHGAPKPSQRLGFFKLAFSMLAMPLTKRKLKLA